MNLFTKNHLIITCLVLILVFSVLFSMFYGPVDIPMDYVLRIVVYKLFGIGDISDIPSKYVTIVWQLYLPRVVMGAIVGASLSLAGVVMQAVVRNPLADPYVLGVSSGASLGATFALLLGVGSISLPIISNTGVTTLSFVFSFLSAVAVYLLSSISGRITALKLILSGTVIASICGAFTNLIIYLAPSSSGIRDLSFWLMGSLSVEGLESIMPPLLVFLFVVIIFFTQVRNMNNLSMGDRFAESVGLDTSKLRIIWLMLASLLVATIVSSCGIIGFVGLIIPHISRSLIGVNHSMLIPTSCLVGGIFMIVADLISRTIFESEIPIGIVTALVGAPFFAYLVIRKTYKYGAIDD